MFNLIRINFKIGILKSVLRNKEVAEPIARRVEDDSVLWAFARFYSNDERLELQGVLANRVLHMV